MAFINTILQCLIIQLVLMYSVKVKKNRLSATFVIEHSIGTMRIVAQLIFNGMNSFMSSEIHFVFITFLKI